MEIWHRDNETLAAYVHHLKTKAKWYGFNSDTATICIFVNGLQDAHRIVAKVYEKDPQTLSEVIKLVEKLNMGTPGYSHLDTPHSQYDIQQW